jgi:uncharacterized membrane protein
VRLLPTSRLRHLLLHPWAETDLIWRSFPPTLLAGFLAIAVGCIVLLLTLRPTPGLAEPEATSRSDRPRVGLEGWIVLLPVPLLTLALFFHAYRRGVLNLPIFTLGFVLLLLAVTSLLAFGDRRKGIRLGFSLSRLEAVGLVLASVGLVVFYALGMNSWQFSFIGDEWSFLWFAEEMKDRGLSRIPWLQASGAWTVFPMALTGWQSFWLWVFGPFFSAPNVPWRMSMGILTAACLSPFYLTLRHLLARVTPTPRAAAAVGCGAFFLSELIIDWARIGKPHAAFLPPLLFAPCFFFAGRARNSRVHFFLAGVTGGLGCFLAPLGASFPMVALGGYLVLEALASPRSWRSLPRTTLLPGGLLVAGFLTAAAPLLVQNEFFRHLYEITIVSGEARSNQELLLPRTVQAFLALLEYRANSHFLWRNTIDPLTAVLAVAAFGMVRLMGMRRWLFLPFTLLVVAFLAGGICQYPYPPPTRMMAIMYPISLLAALGFAGLTRGLGSGSALAAVVVVTLCGLYNTIKLESWNPYQVGREYYLTEVRRVQESPPDRLHLLVLPSNEQGFLIKILRDYGYLDRVVFFDDSPESLRILAGFLRRYGNRAELRMKAFPNWDETRALAQKAGARVGPEVLSGVPESDRRIPDSLLLLYAHGNE